MSTLSNSEKLAAAISLLQEIQSDIKLPYVPEKTNDSTGTNPDPGGRPDAP